MRDHCHFPVRKLDSRGYLGMARFSALTFALAALTTSRSVTV